jgi:hypothetical protein
MNQIQIKKGMMHIMKKIIMFIAAAIMTASLSLPVFAEQENSVLRKDKNTEVRKVELTDKQTRELQDIMSKIIDLRKQMVDKYQNYGIISKEQADMIKGKMDERMKMMREKGIAPSPFGKKGGRFNGKGPQKRQSQQEQPQ